MMSERSGIALAAMTLEEPGSEQSSPRGGGPGGGGPPLRCGPCAVWPRQQTWLCAVPLVMGFVGLGLSLMLLKWIVVGSVQDYVPTDLVDPKGSIAGQDPIFLSKPSAVPKAGPGVDVPDSTAPSSTSTTTAAASSTTPLAADGTAPAPRTRLLGPPANHSANGSANGANGDAGRVPHLHNHVGTRVSETGPSSSGGGGGATAATTTRAARVTPPVPPAVKEVTPRSAVNKGSGSGGSSRRNGASSTKTGQTSTTTASAAATPSTTAAAAKTTAKVQPPTSPPSPAAKPTSRWNHGRSKGGPATRPHHRYRTPVAPTSPTQRSDKVFKPCVEDKDLAFCLNEGECSIIQTVAGVHRHCRCKEGYHGLRCDQFVPKTDAMLSDPTDELGIEFMESGETYQRQVLSIFSIASGICLLGVACMALYRRNKRHREKLQAHYSESRMLRDCSISTSGLMSKSTPRLQYSLQAHKSCGYHGSSSTAGMVATGTSTVAPPSVTRALSKGKRLRSSSLSLSPAPQRRETNHFRTPPIPRGKHNLVGGCRVTGHVYKHLQEVESTDVEAEYLNRCCTSGDVTDLTSDMQSPHVVVAAAAVGRTGWTEVPCTRLDKGTAAPLPSFRTRSVPIIPSLQPRDRTDERPVGVPNPGAAVAATTTPPRLQWRSVPPARKTTAVPVGSASSGPGETAAVARPAPVGGLRSGGKCRGTPAREKACPVETAVELEGGSKHRSLCGPSMVSAGPCSDLLCGGMNTVTAVTTVLAQESGADKYTCGAGFPGAEATVLKAADQTEAPAGPCQAETTVAHGGANCASSATNKAPGGRERGMAASSAAPSSSTTS